MRVTIRYSAGSQTLSAAGASVDLLTLTDDQAQELRNNVVKSMFPLTGPRYIANETRKAAEKAARKAREVAERVASIAGHAAAGEALAA